MSKVFSFCFHLYKSVLFGKYSYDYSLEQQNNLIPRKCKAGKVDRDNTENQMTEAGKPKTRRRDSLTEKIPREAGKHTPLPADTPAVNSRRAAAIKNSKLKAAPDAATQRGRRAASAKTKGETEKYEEPSAGVLPKEAALPAVNSRRAAALKKSKTEAVTTRGRKSASAKTAGGIGDGEPGTEADQDQAASLPVNANRAASLKKGRKKDSRESPEVKGRTTSAKVRTSRKASSTPISGDSETEDSLTLTGSDSRESSLTLTDSSCNSPRGAASAANTKQDTSSHHTPALYSFLGN